MSNSQTQLSDTSHHPFTAAASRECGGVIASGVCYFVEYEDFGASRDEAVSYCEDVGGELAVIPSKRAFLRVSAYLVKGYSFQMVLTGMEYDVSTNDKFAVFLPIALIFIL